MHVLFYVFSRGTSPSQQNTGTLIIAVDVCVRVCVCACVCVRVCVCVCVRVSSLSLSFFLSFFLSLSLSFSVYVHLNLFPRCAIWCTSRCHCCGCGRSDKVGCEVKHVAPKGKMIMPITVNKHTKKKHKILAFAKSKKPYVFNDFSKLTKSRN